MNAGRGARNVEQVRRLTPQDEAAVSALAAEAAAVDGASPLNEQARLRLHDSSSDASWHLLGREEGAMVAYASLDLSVPDRVQAEAVVAPAHRGVGWGVAIVVAATDVADPWPLQLWAHGDLPAARRLADSLGFVRARELEQMRRDLRDPLPDPPEVCGVRLRTFRPGADDQAWLEVNARAFADHPEQGRMTQRDLDQRMSAPWFDPAGFFVAERDGHMVGFHWTKVHDGAEPVGEVYVVGVDPQAQGGGLGRLLTLTGLHHLRERGLRSVLLYVESDNDPALAVYRRLGFERVATEVLYRSR